MMANDAHIAAKLEVPPVTRILADFVAAHPSRGWEDGVDREAQRSFLNWVGCSIGASSDRSGWRTRSTDPTT